MLNRLGKSFRNTNSRFWRVYELLSALVFLSLMIFASVFFIGEKYELAWALKILIWSWMTIVLMDFMKYRLTGSPKDKPVRKWFSFRWAQRYKPEEIVVFPDKYTGDPEDLRYSLCKKCSALHSFEKDQENPERICSVHGCKELVLSSDEYVSGASEIIRKKRERAAVFAHVRFAPFRFLYQHSWTISEHTYKLFSWMLITCAVLAAGRHLNNETIEYMGIFFCILWVVNFVITCFRAMTYVQDEMIAWSAEGEDNQVAKKGVAFSVSFALVIVMWQLVMLTVGRLF